MTEPKLTHEQTWRRDELALQGYSVRVGYPEIQGCASGVVQMVAVEEWADNETFYVNPDGTDAAVGEGR